MPVQKPLLAPLHPPVASLIRFGFRIRSRNGIVVEKLLIMGRDAEDAGQKLAQMYPNCEILSTWQEIPGRPGTPLTHTAPKGTFEDIADLINHVL